MKNKKLFMIGMLFVTSILWPQSEHLCNCGSFEHGITKYVIVSFGGSPDCCRDALVANSGSFTTYIQDEKGVWIMEDSTQISGATARRNCCPST